MGEGGEIVEVGGRGSGLRGSISRPPLPTKFVEQIAFHEIEEKEVKLCTWLYDWLIVLDLFYYQYNLEVEDPFELNITLHYFIVSGQGLIWCSYSWVLEGPRCCCQNFSQGC